MGFLFNMCFLILESYYLDSSNHSREFIKGFTSSGPSKLSFSCSFFILEILLEVVNVFWDYSFSLFFREVEESNTLHCHIVGVRKFLLEYIVVHSVI